MSCVFFTRKVLTSRKVKLESLISRKNDERNGVGLMEISKIFWIFFINGGCDMIMEMCRLSHAK